MLIHLYATLRQRAGSRAVEVNCRDGASVGDALRHLLQQRPALKGRILDADGRVVPYVAVFVEGRDIRHLDGLSTPVHEDDDIAVFPPIAGG
jgi:molybdopterin synthase sulfur carrier subunit